MARSWPSKIQSLFRNLKKKKWQKLQGWKKKLLSQGGREILIKAVELSFPTYTISCFILPQILCDKMEKMTAQFLWGQLKDENKIH